ncbi:molybdate ABC transporter substrate-binding protein [Enterovirga aerilata]|uniref:Molybdate ABC transporter substrate-binding protein n=1 Tax=Enterovirga aerilata TaxID=2730920 RepID=A0A849IET3_9HYPH|nr:molybdate ABC transporter substrate-binding protein [Enterovirga sp. DB1703]
MRAFLLAAAVLGAALAPARAEPVLLHAAGSLREAMGEATRAFEAGPGGAPVSSRFGPSGLLRDEIAGGTKAEVFASANMEHPLSLTRSGRAGPTVLFARNRLCALVRPGLAVTTETLLDRMLDPSVKLGTSTPGADPSGDYAWLAFRRAEAARRGSRAALEAKALRLTGGPDSPKPPPDRSLYGLIVGKGDADIFLTYCTNAALALREVPGASSVQLPEEIAVGADYGLTVMRGASEAAYGLALFILSPDGQAILARHGFTTVGAPAEAGN